jgi:hypothetical protein
VSNNSARAAIVKKYFASLNNSDVSEVISLLTEDAEFCNADLPPVFGREGVERYLGDLCARTLNRNFEVLGIDIGEDCAKAQWRVQMTFRAGARYGPFTFKDPFEAGLEGQTEFKFAPGTDYIRRLQILHESISRIAKANAKRAPLQ